MINATQFKTHFHALFKVMRETGMYLDMHYDGQVYRLHLENMGYRIKQNKGRRAPAYKGEVKSEKCPECGKLMLNAVCMNPKCHHHRRV